MKRTVILLSLMIFCLAAVTYGLKRAVLERHRQMPAQHAMPANSKPLVLDVATQTILAGANRVETYRLADFHEGENRTPEERAVLAEPHLLSLVERGLAAAAHRPRPQHGAGFPARSLRCPDRVATLRDWLAGRHA